MNQRPLPPRPGRPRRPNSSVATSWATARSTWTGERLAGACPSVRLDSPPAIPIQVPMRLIGLAVVLALSPALAALGSARSLPDPKTDRGGTAMKVLLRSLLGYLVLGVM